jgi:hypothetical protein
MIKFDLGDQFATTATNVGTIINVLTLTCKQLLGESLNLPTINSSPNYGSTPSFSLKKTCCMNKIGINIIG